MGDSDESDETSLEPSDETRVRLLNVALVVLSLSVAFAGLEAGLRVGLVPYDRGVSSEEIHCSGPEDLHQFHPEYGWTLSPNATYIRRWQKPHTEDASYLYTTSDEGFRDTYDSGERNVIVVGDSFTEGAGVTEGGQYPHLLDRWTPNTSFHAYGAGGYGTDQELLVYRNVSDRHDHNLVILAYYYGNDAKNNVGKGWPQGPRRPHFELRDGRLVQTNQPVDEIPPDTAGFRDYGIVGTAHNGLKDLSWAYDWTYRRIRTVAGKAGIVGSGSGGPPTPPTGADLRKQLRLTRALVTEVSAEARANDAEVLVVGIPARGEITPSNPAHYPPETGVPYYESQRQVLEEVAANRSNLRFLSLKPVLEREVAEGRQVYGQKVANAHFVAHGYHVMARTIYRNVTAQGYVPNNSVDYGTDYRRTRKSC